MKTELSHMDKKKSCCFSGHRPDKLPGGYADTYGVGGNARLHRALTAQIKQSADEGFTYFICGMALGVDTWAAQTVLSLKKQGYPLYLVAACPCHGQESRWRPADKDVYRTLLAQADAVYIACETYTPYCMNMRNRWMVEHASRLIAVFDGSPGGTASTVQMAEKKGVEILRLNPDEFR